MRIILLTILAIVMSGCHTPPASPSAPTVAIINLWSSPYYPALMFKIQSDRSLALTRIYHGKTSLHGFPLTENDADELLLATKKAYAELQTAKPPANVHDGTNIRIVIGDDEANAVTTRNYGEGVSSLKEIPVLLRQLQVIVPDKYWR